MESLLTFYFFSGQVVTLDIDFLILRAVVIIIELEGEVALEIF